MKPTATKTSDKMKTHSTNYFDTFIEVAEDSKADCGIEPPMKDKKTVAEMQYALISENPYKFTSDDVLFQVYADKKDLTKPEYKKAREQFFSKEQPCFRASPLPKRYGFGIHCDREGKVALFGLETVQYQKFVHDANVKKVKAMRSSLV